MPRTSQAIQVSVRTMEIMVGNQTAKMVQVEYKIKAAMDCLKISSTIFLAPSDLANDLGLSADRDISTHPILVINMTNPYKTTAGVAASVNPNSAKRAVGKGMITMVSNKNTFE